MEKLIKDAGSVKTWDNLLDYAFHISSGKKNRKEFYNLFLENTKKYLYVEEILNTRLYKVENILFSKVTRKKATKKYIVESLVKALKETEEKLAGN